MHEGAGLVWQLLSSPLFTLIFSTLSLTTENAALDIGMTVLKQPLHNEAS